MKRPSTNVCLRDDDPDFPVFEDPRAKIPFQVWARDDDVGGYTVQRLAIDSTVTQPVPIGGVGPLFAAPVGATVFAQFVATECDRIRDEFDQGKSYGVVLRLSTASLRYLSCLMIHNQAEVWAENVAAMLVFLVAKKFKHEVEPRYTHLAQKAFALQDS